MSNEPVINEQFPEQNKLEANNQKPKKRVGILTLGITFIIIGITSICSLISSNTWIIAAKLSPMILIVLGLEVLIAHYLKTLKFDFISCIICAILALATVGFSLSASAYDLFIKSNYFYQQSQPNNFPFNNSNPFNDDFFDLD